MTTRKVSADNLRKVASTHTTAAAKAKTRTQQAHQKVQALDLHKSRNPTVKHVPAKVQQTAAKVDHRATKIAGHADEAKKVEAHVRRTSGPGAMKSPPPAAWQKTPPKDLRIPLDPEPQGASHPKLKYKDDDRSLKKRALESAKPVKGQFVPKHQVRKLAKTVRNMVNANPVAASKPKNGRTRKPTSSLRKTPIKPATPRTPTKTTPTRIKPTSARKPVSPRRKPPITAAKKKDPKLKGTLYNKTFYDRTTSVAGYRYAERGRNGSVEGDARFGYVAGRGNVRLTANRNGLHAEAEFTGEASLARGSFTGKRRVGRVELSSTTTVMAGGRAGVEGSLHLSRTRAEFKGGADAFVGVEGRQKFQAQGFGVKASAEGKLQAGLGLAAKIDVGYRNGVVKFSGKAGAIIGIGGSLEGSVEVDLPAWRDLLFGKPKPRVATPLRRGP